MSEDLESRLHREADRLPEPSAEITADARRGIAAPSALRGHGFRRPSRRRALTLAAAGLVAAAAFGAGYAVASSGAPTAEGTESSVSTMVDSGIGFVPANGWMSISTGLTTPNQAPAAVAANVPLSQLDLSQGAGNLPRETISTLPADAILIFAVFYPRGESDRVDQNFTPRRLPLRLRDAHEGSIEGDPRQENASYRITGAARGWNIDVIVFFGAPQASHQLRSAAQTELDRLIVSEARRT